eukprot:scaffold256_cov175-Ochromonas_danica.AAC.7
MEYPCFCGIYDRGDQGRKAVISSLSCTLLLYLPCMDDFIAMKGSPNSHLDREEGLKTSMWRSSSFFSVFLIFFYAKYRLG